MLRSVMAGKVREVRLGKTWHGMAGKVGLGTAR